MGAPAQVSRIGQDAADARANRKEGLGEGIANRGGVVKLAVVPAEQERAIALGGSIKTSGPNREANQQHKQQRQPPTGQPLNASTHAGGHHSSSRHQAEQLADQGGAAATEAGEKGFRRGDIRRKSLGEGLHQRRPCPPHQNGIEGQDSTGR